MKYCNQLIAGIVALVSIGISYKHNLILPGSDVFVDVETSEGILRGFKATARDGRTFYEFRGIPYALPPLDELRFEPPVRFPKWNGTRNALSYGYKCLQHDLFWEMELGDEDCLYLNVFTPKLPSKKQTKHSKLLPVLVFIHGGVFMFGGSYDYRPNYFMDEDIVLVTLNYRLTSFGFLNTGDGVINGNMGLKDQVMSLEWIRDNIANFGGDPSLVTISGESAGGVSVHYHMLSPMSKGLFHRAISMSGSALSHWAFNPKPKEQSIRLGKYLGCPIQSSMELVRCLKSLPAWKINAAHEENLLNPILHKRLVVYGPTKEITSKLKDPKAKIFLGDSPLNIIKSHGITNKVPFLHGVNSHEGFIYALGILKDSTAQTELNNNWNKWAPILFDYEDSLLQNRAHLNNISSQLKEYYFKNLQIGQESLYEMVDLFSDVSFNVGLKEAATTTALHYSNASLSNHQQNTFLYFNSHRGNFGLAQVYFHKCGFLPNLVDYMYSVGIRWIRNLLFGWKEKFYGTGHGDEIGLLFRFHFLSNLQAGDDEYFMSKAFVKAWTNFAKYGHPKNFKGVYWPPVSTVNMNEDTPLQYMLISDKPAIIDEPFTERLEFWKDIRKRLGIHRYN